MGLLSWFTDLLGIGAEEGGGSKPAYEEFERYAAYISEQAKERERIAGVEGYSPYAAQMMDPYRGLEAGLGGLSERISGIQTRAAKIPELLQRSALASTVPAARAAVSAARMAGAGRGGLAFGGGGSALAARAGQEAASAQSQALTSALLGGEQIGLQADITATQLEQQRQNQLMALAQARSGVLGKQAEFEELRRKRMDQFGLLQTQGLFGLGAAALTGGLAGQRAAAERGGGLFGTLFGAASKLIPGLR